MCMLVFNRFKTVQSKMLNREYLDEIKNIGAIF